MTEALNYTAPGLPDHPVMVITTPAILNAARTHFNCPDMVGVELENGGPLGTTASHWVQPLALWR